MKLIVCGDGLICEDLAAHNKIVIKMTVRMKLLSLWKFCLLKQQLLGKISCNSKLTNTPINIQQK